MSAIKSSAAQIIAALKSLNAYDPSDDHFAAILVESLKEGQIISITQVGGDVQICFELGENGQNTVAPDFFGQITKLGYSVMTQDGLSFEESFAGAGRFIAFKKIDQYVGSIIEADKKDNSIDVANQSIERMIDAARVLNATIDQSVEAAETARKACKEFNETVAASKVKEESAAAPKVEKAATVIEMPWYGSKTAKVTIGTAACAVVIGAAYFGLKRFGISIPFLGGETINE